MPTLSLRSLVEPAQRVRKSWTKLPRFRPYVEQSLWAILRSDRLLAVATVVLAAISMIPLTQTPILPFADMPINTAMASLLGDALFGDEPAATFYRVNWRPVPYWTVYVIQLVFARLTDPLISTKLVTALCILLMPLGMMRLMASLGRDPRLGLWAFLLSYDHNVYSGWFAYTFAIGLALFALAWVIEARTLADAARTIPIFVLLGVSHIQAVLLAGSALVVLAFTLRPIPKRIAMHAIAGAGLLVATVPWLLNRMKGSAGSVSSFSFEWHTAVHKLNNFFNYSLNDSVRPGDQRAAVLAFVCLLLGPLLLSLLRRRPEAGSRDASALALLAVAVALYTSLWMTIEGPIAHWYTYPRYASVCLLFLMLVPAPDLREARVLALLPGLLIAINFNLHVARQFRAYSPRAAAFLPIIESVPRGASVLTLEFDATHGDEELRVRPYHQFHAYITAFRRGYEPYLWDHASVPLRFRAKTKPPYLGWDRQHLFDFKTYGRAHDFVLVQGFRIRDPVPAQARAEKVSVSMVVESGRWRLYQIDKSTLP